MGDDGGRVEDGLVSCCCCCCCCHSDWDMGRDVVGIVVGVAGVVVVVVVVFVPVVGQLFQNDNDDASSPDGHLSLLLLL